MSRIILPGLTLLTLLSVAHAVRADDELARFREKQQIAVQKLTAQVNDALATSRKLEKTNPAEARLVLNNVLRQVQTQDIPEKERTPLVRQLQTRLKVIEDVVRVNRINQEQTPNRDVVERPKRPTSDPSSGASAAAKNFTNNIKGTQKSTADLVREREQGFRNVNSALESSAIPTTDGITFPKDWLAKTERRNKLFGQQLTEKEVALLKTLNSTMSVDYDNDKFKAVIGHLQDKTGLTIIMDGESVRDLNLDYDDTLSLKLQKVTVRTVLKKVFGDKGLTYIIKEGAIQVMTPKKASDYTVTRAYPINDLIIGNPQVAQMFGPFVARAQMLQNAQQLINLIQQTVEPTYWQPNGPGSITFFEPTKSIVVRASAEMHYQLGSPGMFGR